MDVNTPGKYEDKSDIRDEEGLYRRWMAELQMAEKLYRPYWKECDRIQRIYSNQDSTGKQRDFERAKPRYNILWSNKQTIKPTIYSQEPKVVAKRRNGDKAPVARLGSELIERMAKVNSELVEVGSVLSDCCDDYVLYSRGLDWVRYEPTFEPVMVPILDEFGMQVGEQPGERIVAETAPVDFLERDDFLMSPCRKWRENRWVARKAYMTREDLVKRFGEEKGRECALDYAPTDVDRDENPEAYEVFQRACVWEIWDKETKSVLWVSKGLKDKLLAFQLDPLRLKNFFPCPEPAFQTLGKQMVPVPDYCIWGDLGKELDRLTGQIVGLTKALKVAGCYNASIPELKRLLTEGRDTEMIPAEDWMGFQQAGGLKAAMEFLPLKEIVEALARLYDSRRQVLESIYEITGSSDIMRGKTDPRETARAQDIKAGFADVRIRSKQREFQRFCRDTVALQVEIMCEHFQDQTIAEMVGLDTMGPEQQQLFGEALALLRDDVRRRFSIDIETDSTIELDQDKEKQARIEAVDAISNALAKLLPIAQAAPEWAPFVAESVGYVARTIQSGRDFEATIDGIIDRAKQQAQQPPPGQVDPQAAMQQEQAAQAQAMQAQQQAEAQKAMIAQQQIESKERVENAKLQAQVASEARRQDLEASLKAQELELKRYIEEAKMELTRIRDEAKAEREAVASRQNAILTGMPTMP